MTIEDLTTLTLEINGERRPAVFPTHHTLLEVLREECGLTGTKHGCELGECGTCAVLVDGQPVLSCLVLAAEMEGRAIETVEGLQEGNTLHPLQAAFADLGAAQCGYCTPGILLTARPLPERPDRRRTAVGPPRSRGLRGLLVARAFIGRGGCVYPRSCGSIRACFRDPRLPSPREAGGSVPGVPRTGPGRRR